MNSINAKSVQLIELHAFAYCLLSVSLSESFDFIKDGRTYRIHRRHQLSQAHKANIDYGIKDYYVPEKPWNLWAESDYR